MKKKRLTSAQIAGIVWLSVGLMLIPLVVFLWGRSSPGVSQNEQPVTQDPCFATETSRPAYSYRPRHASSHSSRLVDNQAPATSADTLPVAYRRQPLLVELNTADTLTLQLLYGIGPVLASRIVTYRDRLGGFTSVEQLAEVYGIQPELVQRLRPNLTVDTTQVHRIPINQASLKQLLRHPYIEYYQARDIIALRNKGILIHSDTDLLAIPSISDSALVRLLPYIQFSSPDTINVTTSR